MVHEPYYNDTKNKMQHNGKIINNVNLILDYEKGKKILDIFRLEVNHDVDSLSLFSMTWLGNTKECRIIRVLSSR